MPDTSKLLRVLRDELTPVRDQNARLLGAVPRVRAEAITVTDSNGVAFDIWNAMQPCIYCDLRTQRPDKLPGFIPLDGIDIDLVTPASGDDPDLAEGV